LEHAKHLGLREDAVSGRVKGEAKVGFNFFAPKGMKAEDAIIYDIKAEVSGISQKGFLHKFDIENGKGLSHVDNNGVEFVGTGEVNGASVTKSNVKYLFKPENGIDTFMEFTANAGMESVKRFGYPEFPFIKGRIGVNAKIKLGENIEQNEASLNLTDAEINLSDISWIKPRGESANIALVTEKKGDALEVSSFNLSGSKISAQGFATLSDNFSSISRVKLNKFILGNSKISNLEYTKNLDGIQLEIKASSMDLTAAMEKKG
jgi:hypothetical protein